MDSCNPKPINYKQLYSASIHITNSKYDYFCCTYTHKYIVSKVSIFMIRLMKINVLCICFGYE